jgi:hypothetical protein
MGSDPPGPDLQHPGFRGVEQGGLGGGQLDHDGDVLFLERRRVAVVLEIAVVGDAEVAGDDVERLGGEKVFQLGEGPAVEFAFVTFAVRPRRNRIRRRGGSYRGGRRRSGADDVSRAGSPPTRWASR